MAVATINEEVAAQNFLVNYLTADATLMGMLNGGVFLRSTPTIARDPFVKIDKQDAADLMVIGLARVWADLTFLIRGIVKWTSSGSPDWTTVGAIANRLDQLLHDHESTDGTVTVHSFREETFSDETTEGGNLFLHAGGIYRCRAQAV
jgi:hypothetical protein